MKEEAAVKVLGEVKEVLDSYDITFWLDLGALLGAVRERKLIEWDGDIDLGMLDTQWDKIVSTIPEFKQWGFWVKHDSSGRYGKALRVVKLECKVELMAYSIQSDYALLTGLWATNPFSRWIHHLYDITITQGHKHTKIAQVTTTSYPLLPAMLKKLLSLVARAIYHIIGCTEAGWIIPSRFFRHLNTTEFYGMTFNTPSLVEDYLAYHYGDWKVPKQDWDSQKEDGAFREVKDYI